jgi:hypothetical protein
VRYSKARHIILFCLTVRRSFEKGRERARERERESERESERERERNRERELEREREREKPFRTYTVSTACGALFRDVGLQRATECRQVSK